MTHRHRNFGVIVWTILALALFVNAVRPSGDRKLTAAGIAGGVSAWAFGGSRDFYASCATYSLLFPGDPVFLKQSDGRFLQIGYIANHFGERGRENWTKDAVVTLYDGLLHEQFPNGFALESHTASTSLDQVLQTLLSEEKSQQIAGIIADDWRRHRDELMVKLSPVIRSSLTHAASSIEAKLPEVLEARRPEFAKLADRYQTTMVKEQIVPLVREEILPIIQDEIRPIARDLGRQLWERVSLWSFTWRYLYDASPLPEKNALKSEFNRFLNSEVMPAIEARMDEFVSMTERIVSRVSRNEKVRSVVRESLKKVASDPELQAIVWTVIQESVLQNAELQTSLTNYWESDEVREMLDLAAHQFEPTARAIGDALIGEKSEGITPEFSRVLRNQILMKDRRWLIVVPAPESVSESKGTRASDFRFLPQVAIVPATSSMSFPLEFEGIAQSPLTPIAQPK